MPRNSWFAWTSCRRAFAPSCGASRPKTRKCSASRCSACAWAAASSWSGAAIRYSPRFRLAAGTFRRTRRPRPRRSLPARPLRLARKRLRMSDAGKFQSAPACGCGAEKPIAATPAASRLHACAGRQSERGQDHAVQRADRVARQDRQFPRHHRRAPRRPNQDRPPSNCPGGFAGTLRAGKLFAG